MPIAMRCLFLCAVLAGCGEESGPPVPSRARERIEARQEEDALEAAPPSSWPTRVETLRESVDTFESVEACREELRRETPTSVAEGLADLAYDGFFDDVCRALDAVKRGAPDDCDALAASSARAGCRLRIAVVHGRPSACPDARVMEGRDPLCVAWAARNPDLCSAVAPPDDARCRAVLEGEPRSCRRLSPGDRERCQAHVRRYASALGEERSESPAAREPIVFRLELDGDHGEETIERAVLARGVRAAAEGCRYEIALASPHGDEPVPIVLGAAESTFQLQLTVTPRETPFDVPLGAIDAVLSVVSRDYGTLSSIAPTSGRVTVERFEPVLGGALSGTLEGTLGQGETEVAVRGRFTTFLRDVEPLPEHCARPID